MHIRSLALSCVSVLLLVACSTENKPPVQFWRPISEPNVLMPTDKLQSKLSFDLSQCHCGIYPDNTSRDESISFQADKQRLAQTGVTVTPNDRGECLQKPSLVVTECMRQRGWEPTTCSGRMPMPGGGSLCSVYTPEQN